MGLKTYGTMAVDWEERINFERLRTERLQRAKDALEQSEMGALLCFDMNNVRYITATHIGTWAQDKISYRKVKGPVPEDDYVIPLGVADVKREGKDITIIATSSMVQTALAGAKLLEEVGIDAEVVDPRTMWPLDEATLINSVKKTSRCIVMDEGYGRYGVAAELASTVAQGAFYDLDAPVTRLCAMHVPIPFSPSLEDTTVPNERDVVALAQKLCKRT